MRWPEPFAQRIAAVRANVLLPDLTPARSAYDLPGRLMFVATYAAKSHPYRRGELKNRYSLGEGICGNVFLKGKAFAEYGRYGISHQKFAQMPSSLLAVFGFPLRKETEPPFGVLCVDLLARGEAEIASKEAPQALKEVCSELEDELTGEMAAIVALLDGVRTPCKELRFSIRDTIPRNVFLVHGHDLRLRNEVRRFLSRAKIPVTVLANEPARGETILEKFERLSQADFAIALLTPDDIGFARNDPLGTRFRARQNVVLEIGFFAAKFGRERVCCLMSGDLETPSDLGGLEVIPVQRPSSWRKPLERRLRDAGFSLRSRRA